MRYWMVEYSPEVKKAKRKQNREDDARNAAGHFVPIRTASTDYDEVRADELQVIGGSLVFLEDGVPTRVFAPSSYLRAHGGGTVA
jgi:hypothetical protein